MEIKHRIEADTGERIADSWHGGMAVTASGRRFFVKTGPSSDAFRCEAEGLRELARAGTLRVAQAVSVGGCHIATEYIAHGTPSSGFFDKFGRGLARMHRFTAPSFGFREDNYIGATPQPNIPQGAEEEDWPTFYFNKRLMYQYRLAERNGYATAQMGAAFARLECRISDILAGSEEPPALLHGDLWSGNYICGEDGEPVLIDPAVYYGHREAELAMTALFGGFPPAFYGAYHREYPLEAGWQRRELIYRLYHLMNHLNIFGRVYLRETESILSAYLD